MKANRIFLILLIAYLTLSLLFCGTVLAYMVRQTEYKDNEFVPANVACQVVETFDGTQKTSIQVCNTGNIDAYLRIRLVSYWTDAEGSIVAKPSSIPEITLADGWIQGSNNTYYYQSPVSPDSFTGQLSSTPVVLQKDGDGYLQTVEIFAEAIQSLPADAAQESWHISVDADGKIISVP